MANNTEDLLLCNACGTQYATSDRALLRSCRICDDPRQFVPRDGQSFTTLGDLRRSKKYKNEFTQIDERDDRFWVIRTEPQFAIGERAILVKTPYGNVLWDCIAFFDEETIEWVKGMGGLAAVVISHPHFYTTHLEWAQTFNCPIYLSIEDKPWLNRHEDRPNTSQIFLTTTTTELALHNQTTGIKILKLGGHFPGSLVLLAYDRLLIADTLLTTPSGLGDWSVIPPPLATSTTPSTSTPTPYPATLPDSSYPHTTAADVTRKIGERPDGMNTFTFMWSIPNMIPLNPSEIIRIWEVLKDHEFSSTHGGFKGLDVYDGSGGSGRSVKARVLDSMQIQVRRMGWEGNEFLGLRV